MRLPPNQCIDTQICSHGTVSKSAVTERRRGGVIQETEAPAEIAHERTLSSVVGGIL